MKLAFLSLALLLILTGCGGGGSNLNRSGTGELTYDDGVNEDGSLFDTVSFTATRDGWIEVSMSSTEVDPYVIVYRGYSEDYEIGSDDDSGDGDSALFYFQATDGTTYTAKFTTSGAGAQTGIYHYTIKEVSSPDVRSRAAEPSDAAKKLQDPAMKRAKASK